MTHEELFSGFDPAKGAYDESTWRYQLDGDGTPRRDMTLQDPNCVFQHLRRHYSRYTPEMVERVTGKQLAVSPGPAGAIPLQLVQTTAAEGGQRVT